jgi:hypothetical protein
VEGDRAHLMFNDAGLQSCEVASCTQCSFLFLDLQMNHVKERFQDVNNKEVLFMCIGITSGVGRLLFGRIADYLPGVKKVYLQVLWALLPL